MAKFQEKSPNMHLIQVCFHQRFQQEGNLFSQAGKTFWTEFLFTVRLNFGSVIFQTQQPRVGLV